MTVFSGLCHDPVEGLETYSKIEVREKACLPPSRLPLPCCASSQDLATACMNPAFQVPSDRQFCLSENDYNLRLLSIFKGKELGSRAVLTSGFSALSQHVVCCVISSHLEGRGFLLLPGLPMALPQAKQ